MVWIRRLAVVVLVLAAGVVPAQTASAGSLFGWLCHDDCPAPSYSRFHYWTPAAARVYGHVCGPRLSVDAPDRHPEIPPTFANLKFHCPAADPAETMIEAPLAPETSKARYILGPR